MDRGIIASREDLEHERDRHYALTDYVPEHCKDREADSSKNRADYALAQLQVEWDVRSLLEDLATARMEIGRLLKRRGISLTHPD